MLMVPEPQRTATPRKTRSSVPQSADGKFRIVDSRVQPIAKAPEPDLIAEVQRLEEANELGGMVSLFDYFVAMAAAATSYGNYPHAVELDDFTMGEACRFWSKAYYVADAILRMKPGRNFVERRAQALIECAFAQGNNFASVASLVAHLRDEQHTP